MTLDMYNVVMSTRTINYNQLVVEACELSTSKPTEMSIALCLTLELTVLAEPDRWSGHLYIYKF